MGLAGGCATPCKPLGVSCDFPLYVKSCGKDYELVTVCDKVTGLPLIAVVGIDNETGLPTSLVYNLNGTPFIGTTISCSYPFEIEYQIVCQNDVTQFTRGDIWKDGVPTGLHFYLNALGAVVATPTGTITVGSCPLPAEIDQESIDWQPICVSGVTWYFADNYNFNNVLAARTFQPTLYKLGDNGVITTTRPTGTFIQGYCPPCEYKFLKRVSGTNGVNLLAYSDPQAVQVDYVSGGIQSIFTGIDSSGMPAHPNTPSISTVQPTFAHSLASTGAQQHSLSAWIYAPQTMYLRDVNQNHEVYSFWLDGVERLFEVGVQHDLGILPQGIHRIKTYVHDDIAGATSGINVQWSVDGVTWTAIPATNLFATAPTVTCELVKVCEDGVYINNVLTALTPNDTWVDSCESLPIELDVDSIDWNPVCVDGSQYYFADVITVDNATGTYATKTVYKLGDDGSPTTTRPVGTITGGYCCLPEPTSEVCYTVTETYTLNPVTMMGVNGISGSKVYGDTTATISIEPSSLVVTNSPTETLVQTGTSGTPVQDRKIKISFSKPVKWQIDFSNIQIFNTNINFSERFYNFNIKPDSTVIHPKHQYDVLGNNILGPIDGTGLPTDRSTFRYNSNEGIEFIAGFAGPVGTQVFGNIEFTTTYQRKATVYVDCNGVVTYRDSITGAIVSASLIEACVTKKCCEEIDVDSINWHPMCSCGTQYYWADVITVDNQTGLYTVTTYYKLEDDGEITIVRPACAVVLGYCPQVNQTVRSHNNFILAAGATIPITTGALSLVVTKTNGIGTINISGTNGTNYPLTFNNESFSQGVNEEVSVLNDYSISSVGGATAKISEVR